jgi:cytochrome d ubiquinol oxidase subunit I
MLSLLAYHDPNARVQGLETVPPEDRPPINVVRIAFQTMVGIGTFMVLLSVWFFLSWFRKRQVPRSKWFYRGVVIAGPAALIATISGWVVTEVGRQPWVVYEILRTEAAVTGAEGIVFGFAALAIVYSILIAATIWVLVKIARKPLSPGIIDEVVSDGKETPVAG